MVLCCWKAKRGELKRGELKRRGLVVGIKRNQGKYCWKNPAWSENRSRQEKHRRRSFVSTCALSKWLVYIPFFFLQRLVKEGSAAGGAQSISEWQGPPIQDLPVLAGGESPCSWVISRDCSGWLKCGWVVWLGQFLASILFSPWQKKKENPELDFHICLT